MGTFKPFGFVLSQGLVWAAPFLNRSLLETYASLLENEEGWEQLLRDLEEEVASKTKRPDVKG